LAARNQGIYEEFHWAMMEMKDGAEMGSVMWIAENLGLDLVQFRADVQSPEVDE